MPTVPRNEKCKELGCTNPRSKFNSFCMQHGGRDSYDYKKHNNTEDRKQFNAHYKTSQWKKLRDIQLSKFPLCAGCLSQGIIAAATQVDHVFPWAQISEQAFYVNVFQSLCESCHSSKTSLEQRGIFRKYAESPIDYTIADYASVISEIGNRQVID